MYNFNINIEDQTALFPSLSHHSLVQALRIPSIGSLARARRAASRPRPPLTSTLAPERGTATARRRRRARAGRRGGRRRGGRTAAAAADLALDEGERLLAVLGAVALVHVGVAARAAVWVGRIAVGLDLAGVGADEARGAGVEL